MENVWAANPKVLRCWLPDSKSLAVLCSRHMNESTRPPKTRFPQSLRLLCPRPRDEAPFPPRDTACAPHASALQSGSHSRPHGRVSRCCVFTASLEGKSEGSPAGGLTPTPRLPKKGEAAARPRAAELFRPLVYKGHCSPLWTLKSSPLE